MSIYHKLLIYHWEEQGWSITIYKDGRVFATKDNRELFLGYKNQL